MEPWASCGEAPESRKDENIKAIKTGNTSARMMLRFTGSTLIQLTNDLRIKWQDFGIEEFYRSICLHQVFAKIPCRFLPGLLLEPGVKRVRVGAFHRNFFKHLECNAIVLFTKALDFCIASRLLLSEVIGGKGQNGHLFFVLFFQVFLNSILWGKTPLGGNIDNQHGFSF